MASPLFTVEQFQEALIARPEMATWVARRPPLAAGFVVGEANCHLCAYNNLPRALLVRHMHGQALVSFCARIFARGLARGLHMCDPYNWNVSEVRFEPTRHLGETRVTIRMQYLR